MADYPISNVARRIVYTGSAGVGPYAFSFEVLTNTDIKVYKNDLLLTLTTDYTVSISSTLGTGSVTLVTAATGSDRITIVGARAIQRTTDFTTGGDFFANTLNDEMDSQTILVQQVAETADRGIKAPVTDPTSINMVLPINTARAGKTLAFDANGNPVAGDPIGNWRGNWASGTSYQNRDIVKDTTNSNVYIVLTAHTSTGSLPISTNTDSAKWGLVVDAAAAGAAQIAAEAAQAAAELAETNAETAETNAETAETNAETAATNAATSASNASTSASTASTAATNAGNSATAAATSASNASTSASNASTSASNASSSASSASSSASTATTQATNASASASAAATSETNAASSASSASTSATNASNSATSAATSASNAATSETNAASSATSAAASFDSFDDRYLGAKSSAPTLDNDGNALLTGALYFNTVSNTMKVWSGSAWLDAYASLSGALIATNNLSDLNNVVTARDNLGVEIGVDVQAYDADIPTVSASQAEMEAGTETALRSMSPLRVKQAISANANPTNTFGFKNRIINGDMRIDQRNAGASVTNSSSVSVVLYGLVDRWAYWADVSSKFSAQRSTVAPAGFTNSLLVTSLSAYTVGSGSWTTITQFVEGFNCADLGFGTASAQSVTISFWVRSSLTGTFGASISNGSDNRSYPFTYTISAANTWEQKTVTIAGDTTGTWFTDNQRGLAVNFNLATGSTYTATAGAWGAGWKVNATGTTNLLATNGATLYITGVQLEKGSTATSFDMRDYGRELAMCQRYYYKKTGALYQTFGAGYASSTTGIVIQIYNPVEMRSAPTIAIGGTLRLIEGSLSVTALSNTQMGTASGYIVVDTTGATQYRTYLLGANNDSSAYVSGSSEL